MIKFCELSPHALKILQSGGVFVPSPLALDSKMRVMEAWQRLLTLYYIKAGARAVIPGAHTGEFALNDLEVYKHWLIWTREMSETYGENMLTMAAVGGAKALQQAELAAKNSYDIVLVAPTAFTGKNHQGVIALVEEIASVIPTFGFELQRAIPGSYAYTPGLWRDLFEIMYGAKGASFDTYRSLVMLEAAARSSRKDELVMLTGNDDRIVSDLTGIYDFSAGKSNAIIRYSGGLLGHFATDTHAAVQWTRHIMDPAKEHQQAFPMTTESLAHGVNRCNMALFDALGNFENSVWGVKYRLSSQGLLPGPWCLHENGRPGQKKAIDSTYAEYPALCDDVFIKENLDSLKKEVGLVK